MINLAWMLRKVQIDYEDSSQRIKQIEKLLKVFNKTNITGEKP